MQLSAAQKRYLLRDHIIVSALFNAAFNGALAWGTFQHLGSVPLWGQPGIAADVVGAGFFLPFCTCVIATPLIAFGIRRGKVETLPGDALSATALARLPLNVWARAAVLGLLVTCSWSPLIVGPLVLADMQAVSIANYAVFKAIYCAVMAAVVSPVIALTAMTVKAASPHVAGPLAGE